MITESTIKVRARFVGFHRWPDAPDERDYLRDVHRHEFHVTACAVVGHDDREIEFHDFKDELLGLLPRHGVNLEAMSCEMIASTLLDSLDGLHPGALRWVEVWEDGEVGARVEVAG